MLLKIKRLFIIIVLLLSVADCFGKIFNTSKCFDLLCSPQYIERLKGDLRFSALFSDSVFIASIADINSNSKASKLCNLYAELNGHKDDVSQCLKLIQNLDSVADSIEWANAILSIRPQLSYVIQHLIDNGYSDYWDEKIYPKIQSHIDNYNMSQTTLDSINKCLTDFAFPESFPDTHSNIYILDINNAFNLSDESFCCTPLILDSKIEKQLRLNFKNIYIHENLHNLHLSPELMAKLCELDNDHFYKEKEKVAQKHGEGRNEAFVVAAEVFVSNKLGLRDSQSVYNEFSQYVDGSLVIAPIIYVNLPNRNQNESYNDFLLRLFDNGILKIGTIEQSYNNAMNLLKSQIHK